METIVQWSQIVMVVLMILGLIYAWIQIRLMQRTEIDKKRLAVLSLIQELQYNKKLISEYIDHDINGSNVNPKEGKITYELNKPSLFAYERNVILACGNDEELLKDITNIYEKIDACRILVDEVLLIVANNWIECKLSSNSDNFNILVGRMNQRLSQEAKAVKELIDDSILKLEFLYGEERRNMMKKGKLKKQIGIFYLVLSLIIILVSLFSFKFLLYVGISFLGLSLRAFYFTYIQKDEELKAEEVRGCYANYYFYYPLMLLTLLSLVYLYLFNQFISPNIDCVPRSSLIALISLYVGFDIYRIAGNRL